MQTRSSDENSVCPSVCPSVKRVNCDKRKKNQSRFLYHTKDHLTYFCEKKNGWGDPFYLKFWANQLPLERNRRFRTDNRS